MNLPSPCEAHPLVSGTPLVVENHPIIPLDGPRADAVIEADLELLYLTRRQPISHGGFALLGVLVAAGTIWFAKRNLITGIEMSRIRSVARIRRPWVCRILVRPIAIAAIAVVHRLAAHAVRDENGFLEILNDTRMAAQVSSGP